VTAVFEVKAQLKIRDGELDGFEQQAAVVMGLARELDTKTLRYDWFINEDRTECEVREGYVDPNGLVEHNDHVREARDELFRDHAYGHAMTIYGEPSPALAELIERMAAHAAFNRFWLFQGLDGGHRGGTSTFEAAAHLKIREGELEGFKQQTAEVIRQMRAQDELPLRYDWFLSEDGTKCEVREEYEDADALLRHQQAVAEAKMKLFREFVDGHTMAFYGDLSPAFSAALKGMGTAFTAFSFLQGLDADIDAREGVLA
jgi:quinol monooxygenase YgiN